MKTLINDPKRGKMLFCLGVAVLAFAMMCMFLYDPLFVSDEEEIFNKGQAIAAGHILYSEIGSQHMPLMYFIAAVFALPGIHSVAYFRLCFYALFAALWALIAYRYSDRFGKRTLMLVPVVFLAMLPTFDQGTTVLSEQAQAIGMVILGFELLQFRPEKPITTGSCLMLSLAIFLSFGSAFVSIFAIFAVGVTVAALEIAACVKEKRGFFKSIGHLIGRYWKLVLIVAAPFAVMLVYFLAVGALDEFYGWAYTINRVVYPKYLGGYGSSILGSMFAGIKQVLSPILNFSFTHTNIIWIGLLLLAAVGLALAYRVRKNRLLIAGLLFFLVTAATRACFGFHGIPAIAILALFAALAVERITGYLWKSPNVTYVKRGIAGFAAVVMLAPFLTQIADTADKLSPYVNGEKTPTTKAVDALTDEGEGVGFSTLNYEILVGSGAVPASVTGGSCPWLWEYGGAQAMQELTADPPRVFLFKRDLSTWGYNIVDYAPELIAFIDENYRSMNDYGYDILYVRNDYYEEALAILELDQAVNV